MGCDIYTYVEQQHISGSWHCITREPFAYRSYGMFGFLADVCNRSAVPPLATPRGLPVDPSSRVAREWDLMESGPFAASWFLVDELTAFDYDALFEDQRARPRRLVSYREFLGPTFFRDLAELRVVNTRALTRIVFWFQS